MWGTSQGSMEIEVWSKTNPTWANVFSLSGNQGDQWHEASLHLLGYGGEDRVVVRIIGVTGGSYESDLAIDEITLREAPSCLPPATINMLSRSSTTMQFAWSDAATTSASWDIGRLSAGSAGPITVTYLSLIHI